MVECVLHNVFMLLISSLTPCVWIPNFVSFRYLKLYKKNYHGPRWYYCCWSISNENLLWSREYFRLHRIKPWEKRQVNFIALNNIFNLYIGSYESLAGAIDSFNYSQITEYHFSTILNAWQYRWIDCHICATSLWLLSRLSSLNYRCAGQLMMHMISFSGKVDRYTFPVTYPLLEKLNLFLRYSFFIPIVILSVFIAWKIAIILMSHWKFLTSFSPEDCLMSTWIRWLCHLSTTSMWWLRSSRLLYTPR